MNLAMIIVQPTRDFAMVRATNVFNMNAGTALRNVAEQLYKRFALAQ
jgi:hypothetical protein